MLQFKKVVFIRIKSPFNLCRRNIYNDLLLCYLYHFDFFVTASVIMTCCYVMLCWVYFFIYLLLPGGWTAYCCSINAKEKPFWPHFNTARAPLLLWPQMAFRPHQVGGVNSPPLSDRWCVTEKRAVVVILLIWRRLKRLVHFASQPSNVYLGCGFIETAQLYFLSNDV